MVAVVGFSSTKLGTTIVVCVVVGMIVVFDVGDPWASICSVANGGQGTSCALAQLVFVLGGKHAGFGNTTFNIMIWGLLDEAMRVRPV